MRRQLTDELLLTGRATMLAEPMAQMSATDKPRLVDSMAVLEQLLGRPQEQRSARV
jgi:hypothetical protein